MTAPKPPTGGPLTSTADAAPAPAQREVPADVEAAFAEVAAHMEHSRRCRKEELSHLHSSGHSGAPGDDEDCDCHVSRSMADLRAAIAKALAAAEERARAEGRSTLAKIANDAPFADPDGIADRIKAWIGAGADTIAPAAPATAGGLLGGFPIVEWRHGDDWFQARIDRLTDGRVKGSSLRWRHQNASAWSTWGQPWGTPEQHMWLPARLVPASEADADPASRGPIGGQPVTDPAPDWSCPRPGCGGRMEGGEFFEGASNRCARCGGPATFTGSGWEAAGGLGRAERAASGDPPIGGGQ